MASDRHGSLCGTHIGGHRVDRFGTYRSLEPAGVLPQQATRLDVVAQGLVDGAEGPGPEHPHIAQSPVVLDLKKTTSTK